ncbi:MAG: hypothetical protein ACTSR2_01565 [Candidatus Hodarchaeales archaeon]
MVTKNSWVMLAERCPIDISRIISYSKSFESHLPTKITLDNIEEVKEALFSARSCFDSMITTLIQLLYDIAKEPEDKILYAWLIDNLGRFLRMLDEKEEYLLIKFDEPERERSRVGISRLSAYAKILKTAADAVIYESLLKATEEYHNIKNDGKVKKEPRTFLYILFQILNVTLAVLGGITREKSITTKKGFLQTIPVSWSTLMTPQGRRMIKEGYQQETGIDLSGIERDLEILEEGGKLIEGEMEDGD